MSYLSPIVALIRQRRLVRARLANGINGSPKNAAAPFRIDWRLVFPSPVVVWLAVMFAASTLLTGLMLLRGWPVLPQATVTQRVPSPPPAIVQNDDAADEPIDESKTGILSGSVTYAGIPPTPRILARPAAGLPILDESLLVDKQTGGIANVGIWLAKPPAEWKIPPPPKNPASFTILGDAFVPHALIVQTGQSVELANLNARFENVRITPFANMQLNQNVAPGKPIVFNYNRKERVPVQITSDYRVWMKAYHFVTDHPWIALTDGTGSFTIKGLPPGTHNFIVWHESVGYLERKLPLTIKAGETTNHKLSYAASRFAR
jgi:hypothetical protein